MGTRKPTLPQADIRCHTAGAGVKTASLDVEFTYPTGGDDAECFTAMRLAIP